MKPEVTVEKPAPAQDQGYALNVGALLKQQDRIKWASRMDGSVRAPAFEAVIYAEEYTDHRTGATSSFLKRVEPNGNVTVLTQEGDDPKVDLTTHSFKYGQKYLKEDRLSLNPYTITQPDARFVMKVTDVAVLGRDGLSATPESNEKLLKRFEEMHARATGISTGTGAGKGIGSGSGVGAATRAGASHFDGDLLKDPDVWSTAFDDPNYTDDKGRAIIQEKANKESARLVEEARLKLKAEEKVAAEAKATEAKARWQSEFDAAIAETDARIKAEEKKRREEAAKTQIPPLRESLKGIVVGLRTQGAIIANPESLKKKLGQTDTLTEAGKKGVIYRSRLREMLPGFRSHDQRIAAKAALATSQSATVPEVVFTPTAGEATETLPEGVREIVKKNGTKVYMKDGKFVRKDGTYTPASEKIKVPKPGRESEEGRRLPVDFITPNGHVRVVARGVISRRKRRTILQVIEEGAGSEEEMEERIAAQTGEEVIVLEPAEPEAA